MDPSEYALNMQARAIIQLQIIEAAEAMKAVLHVYQLYKQKQRTNQPVNHPNCEHSILDLPFQSQTAHSDSSETEQSIRGQSL